MWDDNESIQNGATDHSKGGNMKSSKKATSKSNMTRKTYSNTSMGATGSPPMCSDCGHSNPGPSGTGKGSSKQAPPA